MPEAGKQARDTTSALYAVPLDTVMKDRSHYDQVLNAFDSIVAKSKDVKWNKKIPIKAFTIRAVDLFEAMGIPVSDTTKIKPRYKHIRVYLGMNYKNEFKLFLTPVEGADLNAVPPIAGRDVILKGKYKGLGDDGDYMLDFTQPCPNTCPDSN